MAFLDMLEKLINERGSAAILRERIAFLNEQHANVVAQLAQARAELAASRAEAARLAGEKAELQTQNDTLRQQAQAAQASGRHCDHCGSARVQRTGARPDPTFAELGVKQALFTCADCGKVSAFTEDPR